GRGEAVEPAVPLGTDNAPASLAAYRSLLAQYLFDHVAFPDPGVDHSAPVTGRRIFHHTRGRKRGYHGPARRIEQIVGHNGKNILLAQGGAAFSHEPQSVGIGIY